MERGARLDDIVNDCIERLSRGESVGDCIATYPEYKEALTPLLEVAAATLRVASSTSHSPEARARGLSRLTEAVYRETERREGWFLRLGWRSPVGRPVVAGIAVVLLVAGMAMGADAMASDSVPGDALYWLKTGKESISLMMPRSDMSRAQEHARLAEERTQEIGQLMDRGKFVEAERHSTQIRRHLNQSAQLVGLRLSTNPIEMPPRALRPVLRKDLAEFREVLEHDMLVFRSMLSAHLGSVPSEDRQMIVEMMRRHELVYSTIIAVLDRGDAPVWPPFYRTEPARRRAR